MIRVTAMECGLKFCILNFILKHTVGYLILLGLVADTGISEGFGGH